MMKNLFGAALLGSALLAAGAAPASAIGIGALQLNPIAVGEFETGVSSYSDFQSIFTTLYGNGAGYVDLRNALTTGLSGPIKVAFVSEASSVLFDTYVSFEGGPTRIVKLNMTDYSTGGADVYNTTLATPGPIAGAGLPLLVGAFAWGMRRRSRNEAQAV